MFVVHLQPVYCFHLYSKQVEDQKSLQFVVRTQYQFRTHTYHFSKSEMFDPDWLCQPF